MKKTTIKLVDLRNALGKVSLVASWSTLPITNMFRLKAEKGKVALSATNLELGMTVEVKADTEEGLDVVLPPRSVFKFLSAGKSKKENGNEVVAISSAKDKIATLERSGYGSLSLELGYAAPKDFPPLPEAAKDAVWVSLDRRWFCRMLGIVDGANDHNISPSRPIWSGVNCRKGSMAAADGFRLAVFEDKRLDFGSEHEMNIPHATVAVINKIWDKSDGQVECCYNYAKNQMWMKSGDTTIVSQTIQGNFPDYKQLIPKDYNIIWTFSAPELSERLSLLDENMLMRGIVRLSPDAKEPGKLNIRARAEEFGEYNLSMAVTVSSDLDNGHIAFNGKYLIYAVSDLAVCKLALTNPSSPGKFTGDIEGLVVVVWPMFVQW